MYVSDERLGCVVNLKETGELNFNYSAMDLGNAAGITLDKEGNIYVCGNTSNSVHVVSPSGERVKVLVTGETISYPRAVAYEPREKKLLVTQGDKDIVKIYSLA
jgi:DNA-binding beta-propeller fold protein YncE